ncbi:MAG TPA: tetraacyldisaccharide 4'-kinase, partial [Longimicrobiales bacterium]
PRGPGREPLRALRRSSFVVITRKSTGPDHALLLETKIHQTVPGVPTARVHLSIADALPADPVVVVTAIARPDLLLAQLVHTGANVQTFLAYPDHYAYTTDDAALIAERVSNRLLVTTAKDAVKLRDLMPAQPLLVIEQQVVFESGEADLLSAVDRVL